MWLSIKIIFSMLQDIVYYTPKNWLITKLGLWGWVYQRANKKANKLYAYYKKNKINPDPED